MKLNQSVGTKNDSIFSHKGYGIKIMKYVWGRMGKRKTRPNNLN